MADAGGAGVQRDPPFVLGMKLPLPEEPHDKTLLVSAKSPLKSWKDGFTNLRNSVEPLMNKRPTRVEAKEPDPVVEGAQQAHERLEQAN